MFPVTANRFLCTGVLLQGVPAVFRAVCTTLSALSLSLSPCALAQSPIPDSFNAGVNSNVLALAVQTDGKILVGGTFTNLGGQPRSFLGRLNAGETPDSGFNPVANGFVFAIAVLADAKILAGGQFTNLNGQARWRIARLNADGTLDESFNAAANGTVRAMVVQVDGKILVGGSFTTLGGQARPTLQ